MFIISTKIMFLSFLKCEKGVLSNILNLISEQGGNILTIDQGIPINNLANLSLTIDISTMKIELSKMLEDLKKIEFVDKVEFIAME